MASIPILGFAAWSVTGKTTVIEKLIPVLSSKGLRVAVIKHDAHGFEVDREGKDSWRFSRAGACISAICSAEKAAVMENRALSFDELLSMIHGADIVLVEGYKAQNISQIGICRAAVGKGLPDRAERYTAIITDEEINASVPVFGFGDTERIAEFIMQNMDDFTHFNEQGRARMVDVGEKPPTVRTASAGARVLVSRETLELIKSGGMKKGDVLTVAQIAGIMGAKRTAELIPMCHPVQTDGIDLSLMVNDEGCCIEIVSTVSCQGRTGVEMEALTAVSTAALTVYDMCKAVQKDMTITDIRLLKKTGGVHGDFQREEKL